MKEVQNTSLSMYLCMYVCINKIVHYVCANSYYPKINYAYNIIRYQIKNNTQNLKVC